MSYRSSDDNVVETIIAVAVLIVVVVFALVDCRQRNECEESGGHVEVYGHDTIYLPISCGDGCTMIVPHDVEKWRCVR